MSVKTAVAAPDDPRPIRMLVLEDAMMRALLLLEQDTDIERIEIEDAIEILRVALRQK